VIHGAAEIRGGAVDAGGPCPTRQHHCSKRPPQEGHLSRVTTKLAKGPAEEGQGTPTDEPSYQGIQGNDHRRSQWARRSHAQKVGGDHQKNDRRSLMHSRLDAESERPESRQARASETTVAYIAKPQTGSSFKSESKQNEDDRDYQGSILITEPGEY